MKKSDSISRWLIEELMVFSSFLFFFREIYQRDGKINQECNNGKKILFVIEASKLESRAS